jgi:hypothetical protein
MVRSSIPGRALDAKDRTDLAWTYLIDVLECILRTPHPVTRWTPSRTHLQLVAMHVHQLGNVDSLPGARVENELALLQATLIHAHVRELTKASSLNPIARAVSYRAQGPHAPPDSRGTRRHHRGVVGPQCS